MAISNIIFHYIRFIISNKNNEVGEQEAEDKDTAISETGKDIKKGMDMR